MAEYNNTLDTWYQSCPGPVQSVFRTPYETVSGWLHWVTGEPNIVAAQCVTYQDMGRRVLEVGQQVSDIARGISVWEGQAHDAFLAKMELARGNFDKLGPAIQQTQDILAAAAETSVEAANTILSLIRGAIEFAITTLAISAGLALFTFGASAAAGVAAVLARFTTTLAQITSGLNRVAQVLTRLASLLKKIEQIMRTVAAIFERIRALLLTLAELKSGASLVGKGLLIGATGVVRLPVKIPADAVLDGVSAVTGVPGLSMPGLGGEIKQAGEDAWAARDASNRATQANTGVELD